MENQLNELWGQIDFVLYVMILPDGTHRSQTGWRIGEPVDYVVKLLQKPAAKIGGKEVAVESKELRTC